MNVIVALQFFFIVFVTGQVFEGRVVSVIDGDTIEVMRGGKAVRVRLNAIDCPERNQAFGSKAKKYVSDLLYSQNVKVHVRDIDRYGRSVSDIYLQDGTWVNKKLIEEGLAWHYKRYSDDNELASAELSARKNRVGLWQDPNPVEPWNFRAKKPGTVEPKTRNPEH